MKKIKEKLNNLTKGLKLKLSKINLSKYKYPIKFANIKEWATKNKTFSIGLLVVVIAFTAGYFLKSFFIVAMVNGRPISRLRVIKELERRQGLAILDSLISEDLVRQEANKKGIKINPADTADEIKSIEDSLKAQNTTIDQALASQGMTVKDLEKNIEMQKMIEVLLADKTAVTDEEVQKYIDDNKTSYPEGTNMDQVKSLVKQQLVQQKVATGFQTWMDALRKASKINILVKY